MELLVTPIEPYKNHSNRLTRERLSLYLPLTLRFQS